MDTDTLTPAMEASFDRMDALLAQILKRVKVLDFKISLDLTQHSMFPAVLAPTDAVLPSTDDAEISDYPMFQACNLVSESHVSDADLVHTATSKGQFVETEKIVSDFVHQNGDPSVFCKVGLVGIRPFLQGPMPIHATGLCYAATTPLKSIPDVDLFSNATKEDPPVSKTCNLVSLSRKPKSCELVSGFIVSTDDAMTSETSMSLDVESHQAGSDLVTQVALVPIRIFLGAQVAFRSLLADTKMLSLKEVEPIALQCGIVASESGELQFLKDLASSVGVLAPYVTQDFNGRHALHLFDVMHSSPGLCNGGNIVALALGYHMAIRDKGGGHRIFEVAEEFEGYGHGAKLVGNTTMYLGEILNFQVMIMHHSGSSAIDLELAYHMRIRDKGGGSIRQTQKWIFLMPTSYMHWVHF